MDFFKYHLLIIFFLIQLFYTKAIEENLEFYQIKEINLNTSYSFNFTLKPIYLKPNDGLIILNFNTNVESLSLKKDNFQFIYNYLNEKKIINKKIAFTSLKKNVAYIKTKIESSIQYNSYVIEYTPIENNNNVVSFFLYDNQNYYELFQNDTKFSRNFYIIKEQEIKMNFNFNVNDEIYLRTNWTINNNKIISLKINSDNINGNNIYKITSYKKKIYMIFNIPKDSNASELKLNFDIDSNNLYDLKEINFNNIDYIYFDNFYYYMNILNYDNALTNYFKFNSDEPDNLEYEYLISNGKNESDMVNDINQKNFNKFENYTKSIKGYKINETNYNYIIIKIKNMNSNYDSAIKTLNIFKETEITPVDIYKEIELTNQEIYKIILDISSSNKYLFYIKDFDIKLDMINNSFKDYNTNLFYISQSTTNSSPYFNITLFNNKENNRIQIYYDQNNNNNYIYCYDENKTNSFEGNIPSNQNLYIINIYKNDNENKVLYTIDYEKNVTIKYKFGNDVNLNEFITFGYEELNYPLIAENKFDLLSLNCNSSSNCPYSILYKKLYENSSDLTLTDNTLFEFFVLENKSLNISVSNSQSIINSKFHAKLLKNKNSNLLKVNISMESNKEIILNNDKIEDYSENINEGKYLYLNSENGNAFITLNFSLPVYQINNYNFIDGNFTSQFNLFVIPHLESNEFINLVIFSNSKSINIFYENITENLIWKEPSIEFKGENISFHINNSFSYSYIYIKIEDINNISDYKFHFKIMSYTNLPDMKINNTNISKFLIYEYNDEHENSKIGTLEFNFLEGSNILNLYLYDNLKDIQQTSNGFINQLEIANDSFILDKDNKKYYIVLYLKNNINESELKFYVFNQGKIYDLNNSNTYNFYYQLTNNKSKSLTFKLNNNSNYIITKITEKSSMNNELMFLNESLLNESFALKNNFEHFEHFKYNNYSFMTFTITNDNNDSNINIVNSTISFTFLNINNIEEEGYNQVINSSIIIINNNITVDGFTKVATFFNLAEIYYFGIENNDKRFEIDSYQKEIFKNNDIHFNFNESIKYYIFKNEQSNLFNFSFYKLKKSLDNLSNEIIYKFNFSEEYLIYNYNNILDNNILNIFFDENVIGNKNLLVLVYDSYESIRKSDDKTFYDGDPYYLNYILQQKNNYSIVFINKNLSKIHNFFINTNDYINLNSSDYNYTYDITYFTGENGITFHYLYNNIKKYKFFHYQFGNFLKETLIICQINGNNNNISNNYFDTFEIDSLDKLYIDFTIIRDENDKNKLPFIFNFNNDKEPDLNLHLLNKNFFYSNDILTNRTIIFNQNLKSYYYKDKIAFKFSNSNDLKIQCSYMFDSNNINVGNDFEECLIDTDSSSETYYYFENKINDKEKSENDKAIIKIDIFNENMTVNTQEFLMKPYLKIIYYLNSEIKVYLDQNEVKIYNISKVTNDQFVILQTQKENKVKYQLFNNGNNFIELFGETNNSLNLFEFISKSYKNFNYFDKKTNLTSTFLDINIVNNTNIFNYLIFLNQDKKYILYMDLIFGTPNIYYCHNFTSISYIVNNIDCKIKLDSYFLIDKNSDQTLVQVNSAINNSFTYLNIIDIIDNNDNFNLSFTLGEIYYIVIQNKKAVINFINSNNYNINELKKNNLKIGLFSANKQNFNYNDAYSDNKVIITDFDFNDNSFKFNVSCPDNNFLLIVKVGLVSSNYTKIDSSKKDEIKDVLTVFELPYDSENNSCKLTLTNKGDNECINIIYQLTDKQIYSLPHNISKCINLLENEEIEISIEDPLKKPKNKDKNNFNYNRKLDKNETSFYIILQTNKTNSKILYNFYIYDKKDNNFKKYFPVLIVVVVSIITVVFIIICIIHRNYKKKKILIFKDFFEGNKKKKRDKDLVLKSFDLNSILPTKKNEDIDISLEKESFDNMDKSIDSIN